MFFVICYDVPDDKRRRKLHQKLKNFGEPVQYSVFECRLDRKKFVRLKEVVNRVVEPKEDNVRYYRLCHACEQVVELINGEITREQPMVLV